MAFVVAMALAACATTTQSEAQGNFCDARAQFQEDLGAFRDLDPQTASIDDYRAAFVRVRDSFLELKFYRSELGAENVDAAQQAVDDMFTTVQDLPNDATAADAVEALQSQRQVLDDAVDNLGEGTSCE
jgi:hypothetical protein